MKKLILKSALLLAAALGLPMAANALPTLVGTGDLPTGVNGLVVDGVTYDVTFSLSADPNQSGAPSLNSSLAATALARFFETQTITSWAFDRHEGDYPIFSNFSNPDPYILNIWIDFAMGIDNYEGFGISSVYFMDDCKDDSGSGCYGGRYGYWAAGNLTDVFYNISATRLWGVQNANLRTNVAASFQAAPIPEPETYALLLAGLALVGTAARRGRARA